MEGALEPHCAESLHRETVEALRRRETGATAALLDREAIAAATPPQRPSGSDAGADAAVASARQRSERLFAVALPFVEAHGDDNDGAGLAPLVRGLTTLATPLAEGDPVERDTAAILLGLLVNGLVGFALSRDRLDVLAWLMDARVPPRADGTAPARALLVDPALRYVPAFDGDPVRAYRTYVESIAVSALLRARYADFAYDSELYLAEADMLLAMRALAAHDWPPFSPGTTFSGYTPVRRLRDRLRSPGQRRALGRFFGVRDNLLDQMLERLYAGVKTDEASLDLRPTYLLA